MLTPTDVHFLVGLLTRISRPDGVEIELGSTVLDTAADELRDVDLTITAMDDSGKVSAFEGIEVKRHKRPLDVTHVEQLCAKLADMPSITSRGIVSASGFTSPSVKKAKHYGVTLYELRKLTPPMELNGIVINTESLKLQEKERQWLGTPKVSFPEVPPALEGMIGAETIVTNKDGLPIAGVNTLQQLADLILRNALEQADQQRPFPIDEDTRFQQSVTLTDEPQIWFGDDRFTITTVGIDVVVRSRVHFRVYGTCRIWKRSSNNWLRGYPVADRQPSRCDDRQLSTHFVYNHPDRRPTAKENLSSTDFLRSHRS